METISKEAFELRILERFGLRVTAEDRYYLCRPFDWYSKTPLFGVKPLYYVSEGFDCDDFCRALEYEWLMRHAKEAWKGWSENGVSSYPALAMGRVKVELNDGTIHWVCFGMTPVFIGLFERTHNGIDVVPPSTIKRYLQVIV